MCRVDTTDGGGATLTFNITVTFDNPQFTSVIFVNSTDLDSGTVSAADTDPRCVGTLDSNNQVTWTFNVADIDGTTCFIQLIESDTVRSGVTCILCIHLHIVTTPHYMLLLLIILQI